MTAAIPRHNIFVIVTAPESVYPELIACTAQCKQAGDFSQVLRHLMEFADADGCVIWEKFHAGTDSRRYFRLADWFRLQQDRPAYHFLGKDTETARAIEEHKFRCVDDVTTGTATGRLPKGNDLLDRNIHAFCSIPVSFGRLREASINLYWKHPGTPPADELAAIRQAASVIPALMNSALDHIGFDLLQSVERKLNESRPETPWVESTFTKVLEPVASAFDALECSIFLEDQTNSPGEFRWRASSEWPWQSVLRAEEYNAASSGLTPWVIRHNRTLRFVDLANFEEERDAYATSEVYRTPHSETYNDLTWPTKQGFLQEAVRIFGEPLPPLSFLCVPIQDADRVVGAIRCCVTKSPQFLFSERHIQILQLAAEQIGHWWGTRVALQAEKAEMQDMASRSLKIRNVNNDEKPRMEPLWDPAPSKKVVSSWRPPRTARVDSSHCCSRTPPASSTSPSLSVRRL